MGMYTELYLAVNIKRNAPEEVFKILEYLSTKNRTDLPDPLPAHALFDTHRWSSIGISNSFYFTPLAVSGFSREDTAFITRFDLKNYDNEIQKFLHWIMPYVYAEEGDHLGHYRGEESDFPTVIYYRKELTTKPYCDSLY